MNKNKDSSSWWDYTWSPITGCSHAGSPGCDHCWAEAMSKRFKRPWGKPVFHPERLKEKGPRKPSRIFVGIMTDMWHPDISNSDRQRTLCAAARLVIHEHTCIYCTKRPENISRQSWYKPGEWILATAENQEWAVKRWAILSKIDCAVRGLHVEPMLGPVSIRHLSPLPKWVVCGPENGPGKREFREEWLLSLQAECALWSIPFWDKRPGDGRRRELPR